MAVSAEDLMKWQEDLSNTSHQREVADLQAAGLNPVLSAGSLSGASTPSGTTSGSSSGSGSDSGSANSEESRAGADTPLGSAIYSLNPNGNTLGVPNWLIQSGYEQLYIATNGDVSVDGLANAIFGSNVSGVNLWNRVNGDLAVDTDSGNKVNDTVSSAKYVDTSMMNTGNYSSNVQTRWRHDVENGHHVARRVSSDVDAIAGVQNNEYRDYGETLISKYLIPLIKKVSPWLK